MSFSGFTNDTLDYLTALRYNNNREFFRENRDWYLSAVRGPALALAEELGKTVEEIDEELENRPSRVLSHINRDLRFSRDKTPYRDFFWLSFHGQGEEKHARPEFWFELGPDGSSCGMGIYEDVPERMNAFRAMCEKDPGELLRAVEALGGRFRLEGRRIRRMEVPQGVPEQLAAFYPLKGFYISHAIEMKQALDPSLASYVAQRFRDAEKLYRILLGLRGAADGSHI